MTLLSTSTRFYSLLCNPLSSKILSLLFFKQLSTSFQYQMGKNFSVSFPSCGVLLPLGSVLYSLCNTGGIAL